MYYITFLLYHTVVSIVKTELSTYKLLYTKYFKDIVTLSLMGEDGWLFRVGKMALKISIDFGGSTRWGLVTSTENFWYRLKAIHCLTNQGQWELRIDYKRLSALQELQGGTTFKPVSTNNIRI